MPELAFAVDGVDPVPFAAVPTLGFHVGVARTAGAPVRSMLLTTSIRIAVALRSYDAAARERLVELFDTPDRWATTLRPLTWAQVTTTVPAFEERAVVDLPVPCTPDLEVGVTKYFDALGDGDVPLELLFRGTAFFAGPDGRLSAVQIPWEAEAAFRLPVAAWHDLMRRYYDGTAWLRVASETMRRLRAHRDRHGLAGWDATIDALLDGAGGG
jgi:hypothetical protein